MPPPRTPRTMVRVEAAGQTYKQMQSFTYLGGAVTETPDISVEIARRTRACWMRIRWYLRELYDQPKVALSLKIRGNRGPSVWMQYVDPPPGTLRQTPHRTPPGLASHHRDTAQETRPSDDLVQPYPWDNPVREHWDNVTHKKTFVGRDTHPNERWAAAKVNRFRKPWGCGAERTGWEGERVGRLRTERHPGVWHNGRLESDGVRGWGVGWDGRRGWAKVHGRVEERRSRSRGEERGSETGKVFIAHGSVESSEATPIGPADESKESLCRRETDRDLRSACRCDAWFYLFFSERAVWGGGGGGGYAAILFILFSFPCSADHERDWPPCKVVFFGLATNTYAECEKQHFFPQTGGCSEGLGAFRFFFKQQQVR